METNTATIASYETPAHEDGIRTAIALMERAWNCLGRAQALAATEDGIIVARDAHNALAQQIEALYAYLGE